MVATLALAAAPANAQANATGARAFPPDTRVGRLEVGVYPQASIDGNPVRFAPGGRIIDTANRIVTPASVSGSRLVRYQLDPLGNVRVAWILTAGESQPLERWRWR